MTFKEKIIALSYRIYSNDKRYLYYTELLKNLNLDRSEIVRIQSESLQKLILYSYNNSLYYRELLDKFNINPLLIKYSEDLLKIPPLTKSIIMENMEKLKTSDKFGKSLQRVTSGGSTGVQTTIYKSAYFIQKSRAATLRNNQLVGWLPSDKSAWIWGSPIEHENLFSSFIINIGIYINNRIILNAYKYSFNDFPKWYKRLIKFKPKVLYGYASIILEFAKYLLESELTIPSIKIVVTTSEKLNEREIIGLAFNCNVYDQYGCREILSIGIEIEPKKMILTDDVTILNINEKNEILLTSLFSYGFPLINYKVGDTGIIENPGQTSNRYPFPQMSLEIGRTTDNFLTEDNNIVSSTALSTYLSTLNLGIKQHQIIQTSLDDFTINYIPTKDLVHEDYQNKIKIVLHEYFGPNISFIFKALEKIPVEKSGKYLMFKRIFNLEK